MQLFKLLIVYGARCLEQQICTGCRLRKSHHFADALGIGEECHDPFDSHCNAAMGGRAILEGFQHVAKLFIYLFFT